MRLFHNCDIEDLNKILKEGLQPLSRTYNNRWDGNRVNNSKDVVYLFSPKSKINSFPKSYGIVLLEVDTEAFENEMVTNDTHSNDYVEYVTSEVKAEDIKAIYVPAIFKERVKKYISTETLKKITFVEIESNLSAEDLKIFAETCGISSEEWRYLRGVREDRTMIDIYEIEYVI